MQLAGFPATCEAESLQPLMRYFGLYTVQLACQGAEIVTRSVNSA